LQEICWPPVAGRLLAARFWTLTAAAWSHFAAPTTIGSAVGPATVTTQVADQAPSRPPIPLNADAIAEKR
jgi:hypothetical protein